MNTKLIIVLAVVMTAVVAAALGLGSPSSGPDLPTVVSITYTDGSGNGHRWIYRQWSDGRLDLVRFNDGNDCSPAILWCVTQYLPGTTTFADVDRDGTVGITDFLAVLAEWDS